MNHPKLTAKQKDIVSYLFKYDERIKQAYLGSIYAIQQECYPDRLSHFAYSLRDVIDLLIHSNHTTKKQREVLKRNKKKILLQSLIDPLETSPYTSDSCDILLDDYEDLSSIAHGKEQITDESARSKLSEIEEILYNFAYPQDIINDEIDEIVSKHPSATDAKRLVEMKFRTAAQIELIEKLPPSWLPYMADEGFFKEPPCVIFSNKHPNYVRWMPSKYLIKCAKSFPKKVTEIILSCSFNKAQERNPTVYADFLACTLKLSIDDAEKIGQKILDEKWYDFIGYYLFVEKYMKIMEKLYLNGRYDVAFELAYYAFAPKPKTSEPPTLDIHDKQLNNKNIKSSFDSYWLEKFLCDSLPKLVRKNPALTTELIAKLLEEYIKSDNQANKIDNKYDDMSKDWRSAIEESEQNLLPDIRSVLVAQLRNCLLYVGENHIKELKNIMSHIHQRNYQIYRRLELYIYTKFPSVFEREIEMSILWYFGESYTHHEYYHLIKTVFSNLPTYVKQKIIELIDGGPVIPEKLKIKYDEKTIKDNQKRWQLSHLEPIQDKLNEEHINIYSKLVDEFGVPENPDYLRYVTINLGQPATESDPFKNKTVEQVFEILKNRIISADNTSFTIVENFRNYVENNSLECSKKSSKFEICDDGIQYALFSGLEYAIRNDKDVEWSEILSLIEQIITAIPHKNCTSSLYDPIYGIYSLIKDGLEKDSIDFKLRDRVWQIIKQLVKIGTDDDVISGIIKDGNEEPKCHLYDQNSLDISLNCANGMSFHIIYRYALWCNIHDENKTLVCEAMQIFHDYLDKKLGKYTISRHAVLGVFFPSFYSIDKTLVKNILEKIRPNENVWISFWDGYVCWNNLYLYVFDDLYKLYDQFLNNKNLIQNCKVVLPYHSTINHVIWAYLYDLKNVDSTMKKFLDKFDKLSKQDEDDISLMEHCTQQLGIFMKDKNNDSKFNKQKLADLWKRPSILQHDLNRWFENSPLDKKMTISLYLNYIKNYPKKFDLYFVSIDVFCSYVNDFPNEVADCLGILVDKQADNHIPEDIENILKLLLKIDDKQINTKCHIIIEKMALLGCDLRHLCNK